ncbi:MAG: hypothetical protein ACI9OJ_002008 [Myxococcota bacterium]|jgi:hypothetical protein
MSNPKIPDPPLMKRHRPLQVVVVDLAGKESQPFNFPISYQPNAPAAGSLNVRRGDIQRGLRGEWLPKPVVLKATNVDNHVVCVLAGDADMPKVLTAYGEVGGSVWVSSAVSGSALVSANGGDGASGGGGGRVKAPGNANASADGGVTGGAIGTVE